VGEDDKGFDLEVPVVASRREFFEQEAIVAGPSEELSSDLEPDEVAERLKNMREAAAERTAAAEAPSADGPSED